MWFQAKQPTDLVQDAPAQPSFLQARRAHINADWRLMPTFWDMHRCPYQRKMFERFAQDAEGDTCASCIVLTLAVQIGSMLEYCGACMQIKQAFCCPSWHTHVLHAIANISTLCLIGHAALSHMADCLCLLLFWDQVQYVYICEDCS